MRIYKITLQHKICQRLYFTFVFFSLCGFHIRCNLQHQCGKETLRVLIWNNFICNGLQSISFDPLEIEWG